MSFVVEELVVIAFGWLPINHLGVRSRIGTSGMYGSRLNVAPTPFLASKTSLGLGQSWFTVEGLAWNLVRDLMSS